MTRGSEEHLSSYDLERLLAPSAQNIPATQREHLGVCPVCRERLCHHVSEGDGLKLLGARSMVRGAECHSRQEWMELAAGIVPSEHAEQMVQHATQCDSCGQEMKSAVADISDDSSDDISQAARILADPEFPGRMAAILTSVHRERRTWIFPLRPAAVWLYAATVTIVLVSLGYWLIRERDPGVMLAQAAAEHRRLSLRIPDAPYTPSRSDRSGETSTPTALAAAEAAILQKLESDPENTRLLQYRSRIEILRGRYRVAVSTLNAAVDDPKSRASVLVDIGTAWLAQGLASQRADELQQALGYLSEALENEPTNLVARFNRAIAAERLSLLDSAESDWNLYLAGDSTSGWAGEARSSLDRIRQKKTAGANP